MTRFIGLLILALFPLLCISQNVGQKGDSIINYVDINGNKQGRWEKKYDNGKKRYEGYFKNNKPIGTFKYYYEDGKIKSIITYDKKNMDLGRCVAFYESGKILAKGNYINQIKDSIWNYYTPDTVIIYQEPFVLGKLNGKVKKFYYDGSICEEIGFTNDKLDGMWRRYYLNGEKQMETKNIMGVRNGIFYYYYSNGAVDIYGHYVDGLKEGKWIWYDSDGKIEKEIEYVKDRAVNEDELNKQFQKKLDDYEKNKGNFVEPEVEIQQKFFGQ